MSEEKTYTCYDPLLTPIPACQLEGYTHVDVRFSVDLSELIDCQNIDGLNDLADERVLPDQSHILSDLQYAVAGCVAGNVALGSDGEIFIQVKAAIERI